MKRLDKLLEKGTGQRLDKIIQHAQNMDALTASLRAALPPDAAANLQAANLRNDGQLVLICTTSAWASRIRFEADTLLSVLREAGLTAEGCQVTVGHGAPGEDSQA